MENLRDWAEGGPEALATPTTGTGANLITFSTPGSASEEHQRQTEERTKRRADEEESESSSSEEEGESPISLSSDKEEFQNSLGSGKTRNSPLPSQPAGYPVDAKEEILPVEEEGNSAKGAGW